VKKELSVDVSIQQEFQQSRTPWHRACGSALVVSLRITRLDSDEGTLLRVDGRLEGEGVSELERASTEAQSPLTLNLEGVLWIDDRAAETLRRLMAHGTVVTSASPYVALQLKV
jgi:hypothetical protein